MRRIAVGGHLCLDLTPTLSGTERIAAGQLFEVGPLSVRLGGSVANTGGDLADLGLPVRVVATIGDDALGDLLRRTVQARPNLQARLRVAPGATTSYSLVIETPTSDRTFWHHVGGNAFFDGTEFGDDDLTDLDLVHVGYPNLLPALVGDGGTPLLAMLTRVRAAGATSSLDLAVVDSDSAAGQQDWETILSSAMSQVDVISPSVDDLTSSLRIEDPVDDALVERLADRLLDWGAGVVAVSAGERGMFVRGGSAQRLRCLGRGFADPDAWIDARLWVRPLPVEHLATTTGAGDAATAGLLYGLATGLGPHAGGRLAMACAAALVSGSPTTPQSIVRLDPQLATVFTDSPAD